MHVHRSQQHLGLVSSNGSFNSFGPFFFLFNCLVLLIETDAYHFSPKYFCLLYVQ